LGEVGLEGGVVGDLRGGARQLLHGGGDLDHRGRLLGGAGGQLGGDLVDGVGGGGDLNRARLDLLGEDVQGVRGGGEGGGQLGGERARPLARVDEVAGAELVERLDEHLL